MINVADRDVRRTGGIDRVYRHMDKPKRREDEGKTDEPNEFSARRGAAKLRHPASGHGITSAALSNIATFALLGIGEKRSKSSEPSSEPSGWPFL